MDYYRILNLSSEPFSNSPDPDFFFQSVQHTECLQKLEISLRLRRGLNVVIGDVGAGKTTLSRLLIRKFAEEDSVDTYLILDPEFKSPADFLKTVSDIIGAGHYDDTTDDLKLKENIKQQLFKKGVDENRTTVFIIDEGQKIPLACLEMLREFLNYETNEFKLLQIVIFAQREFEEIVEKLDNFRDRINFYFELGSLNFKETKGLVNYRLNQASQKSKSKSFFSFTGFIAIFLLTGGFPRKIINLCHRSLLAMIIQNRSRAGWSLISSCADKEGKKRLFSKALVPVLCFSVFVIGGVFSAGIFKSKKVTGNTSIETTEQHINAVKNESIQTEHEPAPQLQQISHVKQPKKLIKKIINGIIEEDLIEDQSEKNNLTITKHQISQDANITGNKEKKFYLSISKIKNEEKSSSSHRGIKILSGPGASIQVRRLIPEKTTP